MKNRLKHLWLCCLLYLSVSCLALSNVESSAIRCETDSTELSYNVVIPKKYLINSDFYYGLQMTKKVSSNDARVPTYQYTLVWCIKDNDSKCREGYFQYDKDDPSLHTFVLSEDNNIYPVNFQVTLIGFDDKFDLGYDMTPNVKPSDRSNEIQALSQVFKDVMRYKIHNRRSGKIAIANVHLMYPESPNKDEPERTMFIVWNNSRYMKAPISTKLDTIRDTSIVLNIKRNDSNNPNFCTALQGERLSQIGDPLPLYYYRMLYKKDQKFIPFKRTNALTFEAADVQGEDAGFLALQIDLEGFTLDFDTRLPFLTMKGANKVISEYQPIEHMWADATKRAVALIKREYPKPKNINIVYSREWDYLDGGVIPTPNMVIWGNSRVENISLQTPVAYFYVDMSRVIDRDVLIQELSTATKGLIANKQKFYLYISNGEDPIIVESGKDLDRMLERLWTLSPQAPNVGYEIDALSFIADDIANSSTENIPFHFYFSEQFCGNFGQNLINGILNKTAKQRPQLQIGSKSKAALSQKTAADKTSVFVHLEATNNENDTYFSNCHYYFSESENRYPNINCRCIKDKKVQFAPCTCE